MQNISAVIVEDSRLARLELKELIKNHPEIDLIGEAENVDDALLLIEDKRPQLVFLDVNMPEKDCFDLLETLDEIPIVIFTTAYDEYAIKSFEYNAFDYLLKPISPERFAKSITKLLPVLELKDSSEKILTEDSQIFIKEDEQCWMVFIKDIILFEIVGNYTRVYFEDKKPLIYKSLNQLELKLPKALFYRVNRQQIINLKHIKKVNSWFNNKLKMTLSNDLDIEVSRRQSQRFKQDLEF